MPYKLLTIVIACCVIYHVKSQPIISRSDFLAYSDFHIHPTYKHYFRPKTAAEMRDILRSIAYDSASDNFRFLDSDVKNRFKTINWTPNRKRKVQALKDGITSNLRNYDQSGYPEISFVPGSILCNSYSPYEKVFAYGIVKRLISSLIVTRMGFRRLNAYAKRRHTPFKDFMAEYLFNYLQEEKRLIRQRLKDSNGIEKDYYYYNTIRMVRNGKELTDIVNRNEVILTHLDTFTTAPEIITPLVMSIEGAQVLYDEITSSKRILKHPQFDVEMCPPSPQPLVPPSDRQAIENELLGSARRLKNLHHRLFFLTLGHFAQNHVTGFAKTLDRDPENFQHRVLASITDVPSIRNKLLYKPFAGLNQVDSIGFKIIEELLNPATSRFGKPTYIDVKHMDIHARIQYYYKRRHYQQQFKLKKLPIIASHFGVSGESQAMAAATGLWPNFDRYPEVENVEKFYDDYILFGKNKKTRENYWVNRMMKSEGYPSRKECPLSPFEIKMYKPLDFLDTTLATPFNPFENFDLDADDNVGWFYPWSINLFDEEIIEIDKSDGIIGLLLDPRQLGVYMQKYTGDRKGHKDSVEKYLALLPQAELTNFSFTRDDLNYLEYLQVEPLLRNMFYIVRCIKQQQAAEAYYKGGARYNADTVRKRYGSFVADTLFCDKDPWELIAIGSDFDGLIDPVNLSPTASYIPYLRERLGLYAYIFARVNKDQFHEPVTGALFISDLADSYGKMRQFFYENGRDFILEYF